MTLSIADLARLVEPDVAEDQPRRLGQVLSVLSCLILAALTMFRPEPTIRVRRQD